MIDPKIVIGQPSFLVNASSAQSINPVNTLVKLIFGSPFVFNPPAFDTRGWWDSVNDRYVPQMPGKYLFYGQFFTGTTMNVNEYLQIVIQKNGSIITGQPFNYVPVTGTQQTQQSTVIYDMNGTTDYVEMTAATNHTGGTAGGRLFMGYRLGS